MVCYETAKKVAEAWTELKETFADNENEKEILGVPSKDGYIQLLVIGEEDAQDMPACPVLRVIEFTTMPDGQNAVKFEVIQA